MKKLFLAVVLVAQFGFSLQIKHSDLATTTSRGEFTSYVGSDGGIVSDQTGGARCNSISLNWSQPRG